MRSVMIFLISIVALFFPACDQGGQTPDANGTLRVLITGNDVGGGVDDYRGLEPAGLEVDHYIITGSGPEGAVLGPVIVESGNSREFTVAPGRWNVTVSAVNKNGIELGSGSASGDVAPGSVVQLTVNVQETKGNGTLLANVSVTGNFEEEITLSAYTSDSQIVDSVELERNAEGLYSGSLILENGFYVVKLSAGETVIADETARIYANLTTAFDAKYDVDSGKVEITVIDGIIRTPDIELSLASTSVPANGVIEAHATTDLAGADFSWSLNGMPVTGQDTADFSYSLAEGEWTEGTSLRLTVFVTSGGVVWSQSQLLTLAAPADLPETATISVSVENPRFGDDIVFSCDGIFPGDTTFTWAVDGKKLESDSWTADDIGVVEVSLTATRDAVEKVYTQTFTVAPRVTIELGSGTVEAGGSLAVEISLEAPEGTELELTIGDIVHNVVDGYVTLNSQLSAGEAEVVWTIEKDGVTFSGSKGNIIITDTSAPEVNTDSSFGGDNMDKAILIVNFFDVFNPEVGDEGCTVDADGLYLFNGWSYDGYKVWGDANFAMGDLNLVVQNGDGNVFSVESSDDQTYLLNDVDISDEVNAIILGGGPEYLGTDTLHFPSWLTCDYVGSFHIYGVDGMPAHLDIADNSFIITFANGVEASFETMYQGATITRQWANSTAWGITLDLPSYDIEYRIMSNGDGTIGIWYQSTYSENDTQSFNMTLVTDFSELATGLQVKPTYPSWLSESYSGNLYFSSWGDIVISFKDGVLTVYDDSGQGHTLEDMYGQYTLLSQWSYYGGWQAAVQSGKSDRIVHYRLEPLTNGLRVTCILDLADENSQPYVIDFTSGGDIPSEPDPDESAPETVTEIMTDDERAMIMAILNRFITGDPAGRALLNGVVKSYVANGFSVSLNGNSMTITVAVNSDTGLSGSYYYGQEAQSYEVVINQATNLTMDSDVNSGQIVYSNGGISYSYVFENGHPVLKYTDGGALVTDEKQTTLASQIFSDINMTVAQGAYDLEETKKNLGKSVNIGDAEVTVYSFEADLSVMDIASSFLFKSDGFEIPIYGEGGQIGSYTLTSLGLNVTTDNGGVSVNGQATVDNVELLFDLSCTDGWSGSITSSGAVRIDGTWKRLS